MYLLSCDTSALSFINLVDEIIVLSLFNDLIIVEVTIFI